MHSISSISDITSVLERLLLPELELQAKRTKQYILFLSLSFKFIWIYHSLGELLWTAFSLRVLLIKLLWTVKFKCLREPCFLFSWATPRGEISGSPGRCMGNFVRNFLRFVQSLCTTSHFYQPCMRFTYTLTKSLSKIWDYLIF